MMYIFLALLMIGTVFLQVSFFPSFIFLRSLPLLLPFMALVFLLHEKRFLPVCMAAALAGFVADAFSPHFFGFWMIVVVSTVILGRWFLTSYGRLPIFTKG
ncbi:MAG: hypothetical protein Q7R48_03770 [bacterium]|nr:hypothetical protein [bacterium]